MVNQFWSVKEFNIRLISCQKISVRTSVKQYLVIVILLSAAALILQSQGAGLKKSRLEVIATNAYFIVAAVLFLEMSPSWDVYGRGDIRQVFTF